MNEKTVKVISILVSIGGLIVLYYVSANIQANQTNISDITVENIGSKTLVCGNITSRKQSNGHIFLDLTDATGEIRFVIFSSYSKNLEKQNLSYSNFTSDRNICAVGTIDEYPKGTGNLEIVYRGGEINVH